jgi:hypothetical protein
VTLEEIIQKIQELSPQDRTLLLRELDALPGNPETECATPETVASLNQAQQSSHDERGLPIEDILENPKAKDQA